MNVLRVALPDVNALTDLDPSHFSLFSDTDNVLIKEFSRGSGTLVDGTEVEITHNLGYTPFYLVYGEISAGRFRATNWYSLFSGVWRAYATTTKLIIRNEFGADGDYKYYIFYDQIV